MRTKNITKINEIMTVLLPNLSAKIPVNTEQPVPIMNVFCVAALRCDRTQTRFQSLTSVRPYKSVSKYHSTQVSFEL